MSTNGHFLSAEIGGTKLQVCAGDANGVILDRRRFHVDRVAGAEGIRRPLSTAANELARIWSPVAMGIGYGGPVDWKTGAIAKSYHIDGWSEFPLAFWLTEQLSIPVFVDNDANVAAYGEARVGAGAGRNPVFYTTIGSGVGGGLIINGQIYHGATPGEVEFGHLRLDRSGTITEDRCSGWSLNRIVLKAVQEEPSGVLAELCAKDPGHEARHLGPSLAAGDALAARIVQETADHLAFALQFVVHLLHPEMVVLGGGVSLIGEPLRAAIASTLSKRLMDVFQPGPPIVLAGLREDAVPVGALLLAASRLQDPR